MSETSEQTGVTQEEADACTSLEQRTADVVARLTANHANTLAMLSCLKACRGDARPYREVEDELAGQASFGLSTQTPHVLLRVLVEAGGIERIDVPEEPAAKTSVSAVDAEAETMGEAAAEAPEQAQAPAEDRPTDYLLRTTDAGEAALAQFDAAARFEGLVASEPEGYLDVYLAVLNEAGGADGAKLAQIEAAVKGMPALAEPKRVYASYFVSKLETVGAIAWDGAWKLTPEGDEMLSRLSA